MSRITDKCIAEVRDASAIEDVIGTYVALTETEHTGYEGNCPFCGDNQAAGEEAGMSEQKCTDAGGCDKPAVWRVRYLGCRSEDCEGHLTCDEHIGEKELDHVVRLEPR